jgi:hypothetical protein
MMYRVSESRIKITDNQFQAGYMFLLSEWHCSDWRYANNRRMPGDWNPFEGTLAPPWSSLDSLPISYYKAIGLKPLGGEMVDSNK